MDFTFRSTPSIGLDSPVLSAVGVTVLLLAIVSSALLRWRRLVLWHATIISASIVATAPLLLVVLNWLRAPSNDEPDRVTASPTAFALAAAVLVVLLSIISRTHRERRAVRPRSGWRSFARPVGGALILLCVAIASLSFVFISPGVTVAVFFVVSWPGALTVSSIWPDGYFHYDQFALYGGPVLGFAAHMIVWSAFFSDLQVARAVRSVPANSA